MDDPEKGYTVAPKKGHGRLGLAGVKKRILDLVEDVPDVLPYIKVRHVCHCSKASFLLRQSLRRLIYLCVLSSVGISTGNT